MRVLRAVREGFVGSYFRPEAHASRLSGILSRDKQALAARYQALMLRGLRRRAAAQSRLQEP